MKRMAWMALVFGLLAFPAGVAFGGQAGWGNGGAAGGGQDQHHPPPLRKIGEFILAHAQDLNLTADQKTQVQAVIDSLPAGGPGQGAGGAGKGAGGQGGGPPGKAAGGGGGGGPGHGPYSKILTPDQMKKLHDLLPPPGSGQGGQGGQGGKKPQN